SAGQSLPDLRDFHLGMASSFASADFTGPTLAAINGKASGDLAKARQELGQIIDFGDLQLAGTFDTTVTTSGDVTKETEPLAFKAATTLRNVQVVGLANRPPINQPWMLTSIEGKITRDKGNVAGVNQVIATLRTGNEQNPTID